MRDTIFALATGPGRAAVAVLRVSGPSARQMLGRMCARQPKPREAALRNILDGNGEVIDQGLVLWFPAPKSFTGEDVFELQLHGGRAIISKVVDTLNGLGARPAEAGEFTRRAFEAGRLELTQAEAVADLVDAETEAQRRQAIRQLDGELGARSERWRAMLIDVLAHLSAQIDFPDEDLPDQVGDYARSIIATLASELREALGDFRGERIRDGVKIALIGAPNAGKSSLFNALVGRDAAIVTSVAGTTRDVIEAPILINGYKVILADMAGVREADNLIEAEGVKRAHQWASAADLRLLAVDRLQGDDHASLAAALTRSGDVLVLTKSDLSAEYSGSWVDFAKSTCLHVVSTSSVTDGGVDSLTSFLTNWLTENLGATDVPAITRSRHRAQITDALGCLDRSLSCSLQGEVMIEDVSCAARALGAISGRVSPEDILDKVFSSFCIGK